MVDARIKGDHVAQLGLADYGTHILDGIKQIRGVRLSHRPLVLGKMRSRDDAKGPVSARTGSNTGH